MARPTLLIPLLASACVTSAFLPADPDHGDGDTTPRDDTDVLAGGDDTAWPDDTDVGRDTSPEPADDTDAAPVDTDPGPDTFDTGITRHPGGGTFHPDRLLYEAQYAVDGSARMRSFFLGGREIQPYLRITLSDGTDVCQLKYEVSPSTFDWANSFGSASLTWAWLVEVGFDWPIEAGFGVDEGDYAGRVLPGGRCDDLAPGYLSPSVFAWARVADGYFADAVHVGVGRGALTRDARDAADAAGVPSAKRLAGIVAIPATTFGAFDDRWVHAWAVWAHTDASHAVEVDPNGDPVLQGAPGAANGNGRPSEGWFRVVGAVPLPVTAR